MMSLCAFRSSKLLLEEAPLFGEIKPLKYFGRLFVARTIASKDTKLNKMELCQGISYYINNILC